VTVEATAGNQAATHPGQSLLQLPGPCPDNCDGVYPVLVEVYGAKTGVGLARLTTHLVYATAATDALRFAWLLPVSAAPASEPGRSLTLRGESSARLSALVGALEAGPGGAPVLAPSPATLEALSSSSSRVDRATVAALSAWAADPTHQVLEQPFAPADPTALARSGLGTDLAGQLHLGRQVTRSVLQAAPSSGVWVSTGSLEAAGARILPPSFGRLVLPERDLVARQSNLTPDHPFTLGGAGPRRSAVAADPGLAAHLPSGGADPVLAAHQLLADLAQIYFECPNCTQPRGVVMAIPPSWQPVTGFLRTLQAGLATSPIVQDSTLGQLFAQVPQQATGGATLTRSLAADQGRPPSLPASGLRATARRLASYASVVASHPATLVPLQELRYLAESSTVTPSAREAYLLAFDSRMAKNVDRVSLAGDQTLTLTSRTGTIPLTLVSSAPWTLHGTLELQSDKLAFPGGSRHQVSLSAGNNALRFQVRARTTGDFPLQVSLVAPKGGLVLLSERLTIRSTAFSVVAIALTAGAGGFLILWWGRSLMRGRRNRNRRLVATEP
ncbi:MAG: DUF6049 family protein, partial [Acidimicrobiales bacterium]